VGVVLSAWCGAQAAPLNLALKLEKGRTYYQKTTMDQRITQTLMGQQQVVEQSIGTGMKVDVLDVDGRGNMRIRQTFTWSMFKQKNPMTGTTEYDSSKQTAAPAGSEPLGALLGQSYVVTVNPKGRVLDVNGVEELKQAVLKKLPPGGEQNQTMMILAPYLSEKPLRDTVEDMLAFYPDRPVEFGDSWSKRTTLSVGFGMTIDHTWTLQKREAGVAIIGETAAVRSDPNAPPMDAGGMKMRFDMSGTQENTLRVNEATGLLLSNQGRQQLKGDIKLAMSAEAPPMMVIPCVFDITFKVETSDQPWEPAAR
jgi:hypothetical protein